MCLASPPSAPAVCPAFVPVRRELRAPTWVLGSGIRQGVSSAHCVLPDRVLPLVPVGKSAVEIWGSLPGT